jgi:hypothetical protein
MNEDEMYYLNGPDEFVPNESKNMKTTFNDTELKRLLHEFAAVNYNRIKRTKSAEGAVKSKTVGCYRCCSRGS